MIASPVFINIPTAYAGNPIALQWSDVPEASGYTLERSFNGGAFAVIYSGKPASYTDIVPDTAATASYRAWAWIGRGDTWAERDAAAVDWATRDTLAIPWISEESDKTPYTFSVVPNRPPVISGQDSNLGTRYRGFDVTYSIADPDPNSTVGAVVRLDSTVIQTVANVQLGTPYTATVTDAQVFAMAEGSTHTVTITATDNKGAATVRTYTFTAVEDLVSTAVFYVLRDGVPIAKIPAESVGNQTVSIVADRIYGATTQTGTGDKSPDNPYVITGVGESGVIPVEVSSGNQSWTRDVPVSAPLYGLPNGVRDEVDVAGGQVIRRIDKVILDGSQPWGVWGGRDSENTTVFFTDHSLLNCFDATINAGHDGSPHISTRVISSGYEGSDVRKPYISNQDSLWQSSDRELLSIRGDERIGIRILKSRMPSWSDGWTNTQKVVAFRSWLSANPVTTLYELAEPVIDFFSLPTISTFDWTDYLAVGTHSYKIRGVDKYDNFTDSNEIIVTTSLRHAQIALVEEPGNGYPLTIRRGDRPFADRTYSTMPREIRFEGRRYPILQESGQRSQPWSLGYSSRRLEDQQRLLALIETGKLFVYRDQYNRRAFGKITEYTESPQGRYRGQPDNDALFDYTLTLTTTDHIEVIAYD